MKKLWKFFVKPPAWFGVSWVILALATIILAMVCLALDLMSSELAVLCYIAFGLSAVFLAYGTYLVVRYFSAVVGFIKKTIENTPFLNKMVKEGGYRMLVLTIFGFVLNILFALYQGVLGIVFLSAWAGSLSAYYIMLSLYRGRLLLLAKKSETSEREEANAHITCGVFLLLLNIALSGAIALMLFDDRHFSYPDWTIYAVAAYAFTKITLAIINFIKSRKSESLSEKATRTITLTEATVSILSLQTALLTTFGKGIESGVFNTATGIAVSVINYTMAILTIIQGVKAKKSTEKDNEQR